MKQRLDSFYPFKHWLGTLVIAPLMAPILDYIFGERIGLLTGLVWIVYPLVLFKSLLYSIPSTIVYLIGFHLLGKTNLNAYWIKAIAIALSTVLLYIVFKFVLEEDFSLYNAYLITSICLGIFIPIKN